VKTGALPATAGKGPAGRLAHLAEGEPQLMLNQVMLWQAMFVGWARERMSSKDDAGASLVEYALLLALIAVVAIGALAFLGGAVSNTLNNVANNVITP